ncbi:MAG: hypothetical protein BWK72_10310 [Rhodoferax ferrireducens]|uniref:Uncharacterized protein n=2 Tax=Pseudomonadota TaxID=1224 RepID=A0A1Y1QYS2_9GAMM|nr:MAG: hypothetical protein BWK72_10310 [Rhodoferax ferrireducens]OQX16859.1 MAG: hypothetical protein BWK73_02690 [Thiothrix lacustris]
MSADEQKGFDNLVADLELEYKPSTATQRILLERIAMSTTKLRRLHLIEDARFHNARIDDVVNRFKFQSSGKKPEIEDIERSEASALPPLALLETLSRYQTALDRQLSKAIGELMTLKAHELALIAAAPFVPL